MRRTVLTAVICFIATPLLAAACMSPPQRDVEAGKAATVRLGEPFNTSRGEIFVLRIQDEFRLIRCIPEGPIAGCYEDVFTVRGRDVPWNAWVDIDGVPGLRVAFLSPDVVAVTRDVDATTQAAGTSASDPSALATPVEPADAPSRPPAEE